MNRRRDATGRRRSPLVIRDGTDSRLTPDLRAAVGLCANCGVVPLPRANDRFCSTACHRDATASALPSDDELVELYEELGGICATARYLEVDKNAVSRRLHKLGVREPMQMGNPDALPSKIRKNPEAWIDRLGLDPLPPAADRSGAGTEAD